MSESRIRVSGFTIAREAVTFGYPLEESLRSLLPAVDELIVGVGEIEDGTWELVHSIGDPKIRAFRSTWDLDKRIGGQVLSEETNKALARCTGDWGLYLQADEVLHEDDLPALRAALEESNPTGVEALSFRYHHFYGSYQTVQDDPRRFYRRATRAVRLGIGVRSVGDGCAFMVSSGDRLRKPRRADIGVHVFHYGWVRPPEVMRRKQLHFESLYDQGASLAGTTATARGDIYGHRGNLRPFRDTHPAVMKRRIAAQSWSFDPGFEQQAPDWFRRGRV